MKSHSRCSRLMINETLRFSYSTHIFSRRLSAAVCTLRRSTTMRLFTCSSSALWFTLISSLVGTTNFFPSFHWGFYDMSQRWALLFVLVARSDEREWKNWRWERHGENRREFSAQKSVFDVPREWLESRTEFFLIFPSLFLPFTYSEKELVSGSEYV